MPHLRAVPIKLWHWPLGVFLGLLSTPSSSLAALPQSQPASAASKSQVLRITPYQDPFQGHHGFVEFLKASSSAKPLWTDESLHAAFPPHLYARCFDPRHTIFAEVVYESPNGVTRGWIVRPIATKDKLPVVIFNRGGYSTWGRIKHFNLATLCRVAMRGYMVIASDFRGVAGVAGKQDTDDLGQGDVLDSFYFVDALKELYPDMDTTRMAAWGFSRGTTISVMMAAQSQSIKLVILHGLVANSIESPRRAVFDQNVYPRVVKGWATMPRARQDALLAEISPSHVVERIKHRPTFAVFHGGLDWRTSPEAALRFAADLVARKLPVEVHMYPETGHTLTGRYADYLKEVMRLLDKNLH